MKQRMKIQNEKQRECEWEWPKVRANVYHVIDSKVSTLNKDSESECECMYVTESEK